MKKMCFIIFFLFFLFGLSITMRAVTSDEIITYEKEKINTNSIEEAVPDNLKENSDFKYKVDDYQDTVNLKNILTFVISKLISSFKVNIKTFCILIITSVLVRIVSSVGEASGNKNITRCLETVASIVCAGAIYGAIFNIYGGVKEGYLSCESFLGSFLPVFMTSIGLSGCTSAAATSYTFYMIYIAVFMWLISSFVPLSLQLYTVSGLASTSSGNNSLRPTAEFVKKTIIWCLAAIACIFCGVLAFKASSATAGDRVTVRMAKFILGSAIPFVGSSMAESTEVVFACANSVKKIIGGFGTLIVFCTMAKPIIDVIVALFITKIVSVFSRMISNNTFSSFLEYVSDSLQIMLAVMIFTLAVMIVGLGIMIGMGV